MRPIGGCDGRRAIAAIVGSTRATTDQIVLAHELGMALVDEGLRVLTGGLGGVMEAALRGARASKRYQPGDTIAVLPTYRSSDASDAADIVICTGMNHARNSIVVASAAVVLAIGGRSGTLGELALAWELGRPVVCVGHTEGWARHLAGMRLDDRRDDVVHGPLSPREAAPFARMLAETAGAPPSFT